jgi:hypothetical protein
MKFKQTIKSKVWDAIVELDKESFTLDDVFPVVEKLHPDLDRMQVMGALNGMKHKRQLLSEQDQDSILNRYRRVPGYVYRQGPVGPPGHRDGAYLRIVESLRSIFGSGPTNTFSTKEAKAKVREVSGGTISKTQVRNALTYFRTRGLIVSSGKIRGTKYNKYYVTGKTELPPEEQVEKLIHQLKSNYIDLETYKKQVDRVARDYNLDAVWSYDMFELGLKSTGLEPEDLDRVENPVPTLEEGLSWEELGRAVMAHYEAEISKCHQAHDGYNEEIDKLVEERNQLADQVEELTKTTDSQAEKIVSLQTGRIKRFVLGRR